MWTLYGDKLLVSDLNGTAPPTSKYQPATFNSNTVLIAVKTWIILYNNPTFVNLKMNIYNNQGAIIATSTNLMTKAALLTGGNTSGALEIWFEFSNISLNGNDTYWFSMQSDNSYTYSDSSHLSWVKNYPDPVYRNGLSISYKDLLRNPYYLYFIGSTQ